MLKYNAADPFPLQRKGNFSFQQIVCDRCGGKDEHSSKFGPSSPATLERHWRVRGWEVDTRKGKFVCNLCIRKETEARRKEKESRKMEKANGIAQPPSQSSALAKKIMSDLLFDHYDLSAQDYKDGWDDKRIATECGLSETFVAQRRSADYGPVKPKKPPVIKQASAALSHSQILLKDMIARAQALEAKGKEALGIVENAIAAIANEQDSQKH